MVDGSGEAVSGCGVVAVSRSRVVCGVCVWRVATLKAPCTGCGVYVWRVGWRVSHSEYRAQSCNKMPSIGESAIRSYIYVSV